MCRGRAGIESAVLLDSSRAMLERCKQQVLSIYLLLALYSLCRLIPLESTVRVLQWNADMQQAFW
jgi:hypothetical protein